MYGACMVHCTVHVWCMYGAFQQFCMVQIVCCAPWWYSLFSNFTRKQKNSKKQLLFTVHCVRTHEILEKVFFWLQSAMMNCSEVTQVCTVLSKTKNNELLALLLFIYFTIFALNCFGRNIGTLPTTLLTTPLFVFIVSLFFDSVVPFWNVTVLLQNCKSLQTFEVYIMNWILSTRY